MGLREGVLHAICVPMNTNQQDANVVRLRDFLKMKFPQAHEVRNTSFATFKTGIPCLDAAGLSVGGITEITGEGVSCGAGLLIASLMEQRGAERAITALVDGADAFDPWSIRSEALERVLWVRCRDIQLAIKATDLLLRDGNATLVLLDLQLYPARALQGLPSSVWHRLRVLAEKTGASLCVFTPCRTVGCASSRLLLDHQFTLEDQNTTRSVLTARLKAQVDRQKNAGAWGHETLAKAN